MLFQYNSVFLNQLNLGKQESRFLLYSFLGFLALLELLVRILAVLIVVCSLCVYDAHFCTCEVFVPVLYYEASSCSVCLEFPSYLQHKTAILAHSSHLYFSTGTIKSRQLLKMWVMCWNTACHQSIMRNDRESLMAASNVKTDIFCCVFLIKHSTKAIAFKRHSVVQMRRARCGQSMCLLLSLRLA